MSHDDHDHDHDHDPIGHDDEPAVATRVRELESVLVEKGVITREDLRKRIDWLVSRDPADGARLVARAWVDPEFKQRLLADAREAALDVGLDPGPSPVVVALENTEDVHHMVVCTLCSCYPRALLGPPPDWYKSLPYRSRAVSDPRGVLSEFGVELPADVEVRVVDSTADIRYLVIPRRPAGSEEHGRRRARPADHPRLDDRRRARRRALALEPLDRGAHEPRQRAQLVAALEHSCEARRQPASTPCQLAEPVLGDFDVGHRVVDVSVEAGRDDEQVRPEALHGRRDRVVERVEVLLVSRAGRHRDVERRVSLIGGPAGAGVERPLVERHEEHAVVVAEDVLRPVAVVDVPVEDRDALEAELGLRETGGDGDVVEEAEAHRAAGERMVAGWPYEREAVALDGLDRAPGGEQRRAVGRLR